MDEQQATTIASEDSAAVILRETPCKTILNRGSLSDYTLNCYTGCTHGCVYCYARFMQRFHPHAEPWGKFVDVKINAVEVLKRQLRRTPPGGVFLSSACDAWQPIEAECRLTRRCCELLLERGFGLSILTKSALVLRDLDIFSGCDVRIGVTVTTLDENLCKLWEPNASSVAERFRVLAEARRVGLKTSIMFGPLLPFLSDTQKTIEGLFQQAKESGVDSIWVDVLNPRPRVWPAVAELLRKGFPELREPYRKMLFDRQERSLYIAEIRGRVARAAERIGIVDRVSGCGM
jgi:DNA repair photolyase